MDIYLDIDGVLLANTTHAAYFADDFLQFVLTHFPDSTHWLTTHQWRGQDRTRQLLRPVLRPATFKLLSRVQPTNWRDFKTDGIDFSRPFRWYDDDLMPEEDKILQTFGARQNWVEVDLSRNPGQLMDEIARLKALL